MPMWKLAPACDYLGRRKLREKYHIESDCEPLAEAWVLSCHPDGMSRLAEGEMKGLTLPEAALKYPGNFFGTRCAEFEEFPMLVKLIDAKRDLSVQVHPDDEYARREEHQSGKAEMWMVLEAEPGAALYYGFARAVSQDEIRKSLAEKYPDRPAAAGAGAAGDILHSAGDGARHWGGDGDRGDPAELQCDLPAV